MNPKPIYIDATEITRKYLLANLGRELTEALDKEFSSTPCDFCFKKPEIDDPGCFGGINDDTPCEWLDVRNAFAKAIKVIGE